MSEFTKQILCIGSPILWLNGPRFDAFAFRYNRFPVTICFLRYPRPPHPSVCIMNSIWSAISISRTHTHSNCRCQETHTLQTSGPHSHTAVAVPLQCHCNCHSWRIEWHIDEWHMKWAAVSSVIKFYRTRSALGNFQPCPARVSRLVSGEQSTAKHSTFGIRYGTIILHRMRQTACW